MNLRVCMANNYLGARGGSERVMLDEMAWLWRQGHEALAFGRVPAGSAGEWPHGELLPPLLELDQFRGLGQLRAAVRTIYNPATGRRFAQFLMRARPRLVHAHNIYSGLTTAVLDAARRAGLPSVVTLHDYKLVCPAYTMLSGGRPCTDCVGHGFSRCVARRCHKGSLAVSLVSALEATFNQWAGQWRQARLLLCPSRFLRDQVIAHGYPSEQARWLPNGVDPAAYAPADEEAPYYLYFGRLSAEKGVGVLLAASRGVSLPLRIAGDGPERPRLEAQARAAGLKVRFEGFQHGAALAELVRRAAFVVVPSQWHENASMAVLEAMAYAKAIVATRMGGLPEQVADGETGLLVEPGDPLALREAIARLAADPALRRKLGRAGRDRLEKEFSLARHGERLVSFYEEALASAR